MNAIFKLYSKIRNIGIGTGQDLSNYIFYKIVYYDDESRRFTIQCINTNTFFIVHISSLLCDLDILYSLHPIQACFVGIEAVYYFKTKTDNSSVGKGFERYQNASRYGSCQMLYLDRKSKVHFYDKRQEMEYAMDAVEIAASRELIQEFDSIQAYYIGYLSALTILRSPSQKKTTLRLVK